MRLEDADDTLEAAAQGTVQRDAPLAGQMGVVVDEGDTPEVPAEFEAPCDPGKAGERPPGVFRVDPELEGCRDGGSRVARVVETGHRQLEQAEALTGAHKLETEVVAPGLDPYDRSEERRVGAE